MARTTEIIADINKIEAGEWNHLTKERPFAAWQWLQLTRTVLVERQPRYVFLREWQSSGCRCLLHPDRQSCELYLQFGNCPPGNSKDFQPSRWRQND